MTFFINLILEFDLLIKYLAYTFCVLVTDDMIRNQVYSTKLKCKSAYIAKKNLNN